MVRRYVCYITLHRDHLKAWSGYSDPTGCGFATSRAPARDVAPDPRRHDVESPRGVDGLVATFRHDQGEAAGGATRAAPSGAPLCRASRGAGPPGMPAP